MKGAAVMHCSDLQALNVDVNLHKEAEIMASSTQGSATRHLKNQRLDIGCWNMCTLVEAEGSIATSVSRPSSRGVTVDRNATLMVQELERFKMNITGISETKWFEQAVYQVNGYTVLHSGHPISREIELAD